MTVLRSHSWLVGDEVGCGVCLEMSNAKMYRTLRTNGLAHNPLKKATNLVDK